MAEWCRLGLFYSCSRVRFPVESKKKTFLQDKLRARDLPGMPGDDQGKVHQAGAPEVRGIPGAPGQGTGSRGSPGVSGDGRGSENRLPAGPPGTPGDLGGPVGALFVSSVGVWGVSD